MTGDARVGGRWRRGWRRLNDFYDQLFLSRYRSLAGRELRDEEDLFLLLCFSDLLGIPNPVAYYTLELLPEMLERFHRWHLRQGLERSPIEGFG
ncbi:MAG: hypothetical protein KDB94_07625 [Acidobacteria bacterium]|nr:hypothetical protein [Acidobacteriota bacterium]MCB9377789.1 hypothetical protein [Holophagales bacterium]